VELLAKHHIPLIEDDIMAIFILELSVQNVANHLIKMELCYGAVLFPKPWHLAIVWVG
jgi:hypothetical protein